MQDLRRWSNDSPQWRGAGNLLPFVARVDDRQERQGLDFGMRPLRGEAGDKPVGADFRAAARPMPSSADPSAFGRAEAAARSIATLYAGQIEAVQKDTSLTPEQKAAAVRALRDRQKADTRAARQRIMDEAKATMQAVRRSEQELTARHLAQEKNLH
jgi:hypothetical protein